MSGAGISGSQKIFIPCEIFSLRVVLAPSEAPSPLEQLVMKAVHTGARSIEELTVLFAIGHRPMLRLTLDLLRRSYVTYNFETGQIFLTAHVMKAIQENRLDKLDGTERTEEPVQLMRDLVAGTIVTQRRRPDVLAGFRVRSDSEPNSAARVDMTEVLRVVRRQLRDRTTRAVRPLHVQEVALDLPGSGQSGELRDLELEVRPYLDDAERLHIVIEQPTDLSWRSRFELEKKLTDLANLPEPEAIFKNLRDKAAPRSASSKKRGLYIEFRDLRSQVEELARADIGTFPSRQEQLERSASAVEGSIALQGTPDVDSEIITTATRHVAVVKEMILAARRQVVIGGPFIRHEATWEFREEIDSALERGRKVFLLLGIGDELAVDTGVGSWLEDRRKRYPDRFFCSAKSARCHAKFVIADGSDVLLTSYNFLATPPGKILEVGIRLTSAAKGSPPERPALRVATELVAAAKQIFPDSVDAQRMIDNPRAFGAYDSSSLPDLRVPVLPQVTDGDRFQPQRRALWRRDWRRYVDRLAAVTKRFGGTYNLTRDAEHRQLLYDALDNAKYRLAIFSDRVTTRVVDRTFREKLSHLGKGVQVVLVYRRGDPEAIKILREIEVARGVQILHRAAGESADFAESHAKLLICDDWASVTSLNFLSHSADYDGPKRHQLSTEAGVLVQGVDAVQALCERLSQVIPALTPLCEAGRQQPEIQIGSDWPLVRDLDELLDALNESNVEAPNESPEEERRRDGEVIARWFANVRDADMAFGELEELATIEAPFLEQAIAACLHLHPMASPAAREKWFGRLIEEMWWRNDPHGAFILLGSVSPVGHPSIPTRDVAYLAALCKTGHARPQHFDDVAVNVADAADDASAIAVAALAIPAVLFDRDPPYEALPVITKRLPPPLRNWADSAVAFRMQHGQGLTGSELGSVPSLESLRQRTDAARTDLIAELSRCVGLNLGFKLGQLSWSRIVGGPLGLQRLLTAANANDLGIVREFLAVHGEEEPSDWLDEVVREAAATMTLPSRERAIVRDRRRLCIDHLRKVIRGSSLWLSEASSLAAAEKSLPADAILRIADQFAADQESVVQLIRALDEERRYPALLLAQMIERTAPLLQQAKR